MGMQEHGSLRDPISGEAGMDGWSPLVRFCTKTVDKCVGWFRANAGDARWLRLDKGLPHF